MERPIPYTGEKPFVFISYSHRDSNIVWPIISRMIKDGYRVWYDDGINPGTEWDEYIANKISTCSYFMAFISDNYMKSDNCKDELNYARDKVENKLLMYISDTQLPSGMEMRLGRIQAIHLAAFKNENAFFNKLYTSKNIDILHEGSSDNVTVGKDVFIKQMTQNNAELTTEDKAQIMASEEKNNKQKLVFKRDRNGNLRKPEKKVEVAASEKVEKTEKKEQAKKAPKVEKAEKSEKKPIIKPLITNDKKQDNKAEMSEAKAEVKADTVAANKASKPVKSEDSTAKKGLVLGPDFELKNAIITAVILLVTLLVMILVIDDIVFFADKVNVSGKITRDIIVGIVFILLSGAALSYKKIGALIKPKAN